MLQERRQTQNVMCGIIIKRKHPELLKPHKHKEAQPFLGAMKMGRNKEQLLSKPFL